MFFKKNRDAVIYGILLFAFTVYVLLDTFVIPRSYEPTAVVEEGTENNTLEENKAESGETSEDSETKHDNRHRNGRRKRNSSDTAEDTPNPDDAGQDSSEDKIVSSEKGTVIDTYSSEDKTLTVYEYRVQNTEIYVADVALQNTKALQTAFAKDTYGKNVTAKTSEIASDKNAVLAINGDFYGARERGYVIRNGQLYRGTSAGEQEDLVIYEDGAFEVINESEITAENLLKKGAWQVLSFGPALLQDGKIAVSAGEEVGKAMASNPRTAIGIIDDLHYVFVVSDGRTKDSEGLSLSELAAFMDDLGIKTAYNLDGGGSSTMYFNGQVVNHPTTSGRSIKERSVSDIVYIRQ